MVGKSYFDSFSCSLDFSTTESWAFFFGIILRRLYGLSLVCFCYSLQPIYLA